MAAAPVVGWALDRAATFNSAAIAAPQNLHPVELAVQEELERVRDQKFGADEIAGAQSALLQSSLQPRAQDETVARQWGQLP